MPRFYFHIHDSFDAEDDEGSELNDAQAARRYALNCVRQLIGDEARTGTLNLRHHIEITDDRGELVDRVCFGDAVTIER